VATGWTDRAELERLGPDLLLEDLRGTEALLDWVRAVDAAE